MREGRPHGKLKSGCVTGQSRRRMENIGVDYHTVSLGEQKAPGGNLKLYRAAFYISDFQFFVPVPRNGLLRPVRIKPLISGTGKSGSAMGVQFFLCIVQIQSACLQSHNNPSRWFCENIGRFYYIISRNRHCINQEKAVFLLISINL